MFTPYHIPINDDYSFIIQYSTRGEYSAAVYSHVLGQISYREYSNDELELRLFANQAIEDGSWIKLMPK